MSVRETILNARGAIRRERQATRNRSSVDRGTRDGSIFFADELAAFLERDPGWIAETAAEYRACYPAWKYLSGLRSPARATDGVAKSLDVAEGLAVWSLVKHLRPMVVVELGVQYGVSSRLWKEALKRYVPGHELILCDLEDRRRFIRDDECTFIRGDACELLPAVMKSHTVDLLHNDAHPYRLIRWSVEEGLKNAVGTFTFHDVGRGPRVPFRVESAQMTFEEKLAHSEDISGCGHWERHVMGELFDERILHEDTADTDRCAVQIFDSLFGFGAVQLKARRTT